MATTYDLGTGGTQYFYAKTSTPDNYQYMGTGHWLVVHNGTGASQVPIKYSTNGTDWFLHGALCGTLLLYSCDMYLDLDNGPCTVERIPVNVFIGVNGGTYDKESKKSKNF